MRFAIATLGCKVNQYDSAVIEARLAARGAERGEFDGVADVYVDQHLHHHRPGRCREPQTRAACAPAQSRSARGDDRMPGAGESDVAWRTPPRLTRSSGWDAPMISNMPILEAAASA